MTQEDEARERRITMEIVVDAYAEDERVTGWYCYLEVNLEFAFTTKCISESPLSLCSPATRSRLSRWLASRSVRTE